MLPKDLDSIDAEYLRTLPTHGPGESKRVEYKSRFRDKSDSANGIDRDTFRKDVSQFANTEGGDLVIGVKEQRGFPVEVPGVDLGTDTPHSTKERLDQILLELQPRLTGHRIVHHEVHPGHFVFVVRIPQSFRAPHCIGNGKGFFYRTNSGRDAMNVDQVRSAFLSAEGIETRLRRFRIAQADVVITNPRFPLAPGLIVVMHVLPVVGASRNTVIDVVQDKATLIEGGLAGFRMHSSGVNFDGCYSRVGYSAQPSGGYIQWHRNGFRESVWVYYQHHTHPDDRPEPPVLDEISVARNVIADIKQTLTNLRRVEVPPPYYVAVTLLNCEGCQLGFVRPQAGMLLPHTGSTVLSQGRLELQEILIESEDAALPALLRPTFDQLANAFGLERSANYDAAGNWVHAATG